MNSAILTLEPEAMTAATNPKAPECRASELPKEAQWQAVLARDSASDGKFVFAVSSTGVYCRPSCPARRPRRENVAFFRHPQEAESAGYRACLRCRPQALRGNPQQELIKSVCRYIDQHLDEPITLAQIGAEFRLSPFHLQRTFKSVLGITPKEYANSCRMAGFRQNLKAGHSVTRAMHEAGYNSSSRLYARTASELGMEPAKYRRGAIAAPIRYTCADSPLGRLLIAATDKGICSIKFADSDEELEQGLKQEFPYAIRRRDDRDLAELAQKVMRLMSRDGRETGLPSALPADARGW
jgi:AraC family transcriptional regulator, regulatory protein of adaptative response / methylated-DNA-[protein]-cysteine methyltransferase